jgi:hypothetical protein
VISTLAGCDKAVDHHCILEETMASGCTWSHFVPSVQDDFTDVAL